MNALHSKRSPAARAFLFATMVIGVAACQSGARTQPDQAATQPIAAAPAGVSAAALSDPSVQVLLADLHAAAQAHDPRAFHQFRAQLNARLGPATVAQADTTYRHALANFIAADDAHDAHSRATYRATLRALCADTAHGRDRVVRRRPGALGGRTCSFARSERRMRDGRPYDRPEMSARVSSPIFIGRLTEMATLSDALARAEDGVPVGRPRRWRGGHRQEPARRRTERPRDASGAASSSKVAASASVPTRVCHTRRSQGPSAASCGTSIGPRSARSWIRRRSSSARLVPDLIAPGMEGPAADAPAGVGPDTAVRRLPHPPGTSRGAQPDRAHRRGPALGRPLDPRPPHLPRAQSP